MCLVTERPDFGPDQIKSPEDVKIGAKVIQVYFKDQESKPVTVVDFFIHPIGKGMIVETSEGHRLENFFTDDGLEPYPDGRWNDSNWLKKVKKEEKTQ